MSEGGKLKRTHACGELRSEDIGKTVCLAGWAQRCRDHGGLIFIDLRDREGVVQVVCNPRVGQPEGDTVRRVRGEYVLAVEGVVEARPEGTVNPSLPTGEVEVRATHVEILNEAKTPPFEISDSKGIDEGTRLRYRYLDLRTARMQRNLQIRHRFIRAIRDYLDARGFWEVETPFLIRSTPEGARDYIVPARLHPGKFYALPQSPQLFKQLLMVSGVEKYYQIARCLRDEDPRADRQPEHTQIDMEMSFVDEDDVMAVTEGMLTHAFGAVGVKLQPPFPRLPYAEAMACYGSDKPDTRFGMELVDLSSIFSATELSVFRGALDARGAIKGIKAEACARFSRKETQDLEAFARRFGAGGLAHFAVEEAGQLRSPMAKFLNDQEKSQLLAAFNAKPGDLLLVVADRDRKIVHEALGRLRVHLGEGLGLAAGDALNFLWVTDFPLFAYNDKEKRIEPEHHPFSRPKDEDLPLMETDPLRVRGRLYDLVVNGNEVASGSIRIHERELQQKVFDVIQLSAEEADKRFGFLLEAFQYGAPPHGGIAPGVDRLLTLILGEDNIREVIAFPKTATGADPLTGAPAEVDPGLLAELKLHVIASEDKEPEK